MPPALNIETGIPAATAFLMTSPMAPVLGSVTAMPSGFLSMAAWMSWACFVASGSLVYWKSTPSLAAAASAPLRMRSQNVSPGAWWVTMMTVIVFSAAAPPPPAADVSAPAATRCTRRGPSLRRRDRGRRHCLPESALIHGGTVSFRGNCPAALRDQWCRSGASRGGGIGGAAPGGGCGSPVGRLVGHGRNGGVPVASGPGPDRALELAELVGSRCSFQRVLAVLSSNCSDIPSLKPTMPHDRADRTHQAPRCSGSARRCGPTVDPFGVRERQRGAACAPGVRGRRAARAGSRRARRTPAGSTRGPTPATPGRPTRPSPAGSGPSRSVSM